MKYVLTVGTNLGDKMANIEHVVDAINNIPYTDVIGASSVYQTEPVGYARQDDFYNAILLVESVLDPHEMLGACLGIEAALGRIRAIRFGPRIIDVDIIFAEGETINTPNLKVPHPRYSERRFVLEPMLDLFPDGVAFGIEFKHFLDNISGQGVERVAEIDKKMIVGADIICPFTPTE